MFAGDHLPSLDERPDATGEAAHCACPKCAARLTLYRSPAPRIDACGFESYNFACDACGAPLAGIIDPYDDALLVTEAAD
jgi:hypothetical protein